MPIMGSKESQFFAHQFRDAVAIKANSHCFRKKGITDEQKCEQQPHTDQPCQENVRAMQSTPRKIANQRPGQWQRSLRGHRSHRCDNFPEVCSEILAGSRGKCKQCIASIQQYTIVNRTAWQAWSTVCRRCAALTHKACGPTPPFQRLRGCAFTLNHALDRADGDHKGRAATMDADRVAINLIFKGQKPPGTIEDRHS